MNGTLTSISNRETVARILHRNWLVDNRLQLGAFALCKNETYISVNRPIIESFESDVRSFVESHPDYQYGEGSCRCAMLGVKDIRDIQVILDGKTLNVDVEVEPRSAHIASHAGIFTRIDDTNLKRGGSVPKEALPLGMSADDLLMEVGWSLIDISTIQEMN